VLFGQRLFGPNTGTNLDVVDKLAGVAADLSTTLPRLALAWVLRHSAVSVALSGCRSPREIEENVEAAQLAIPEAALTEIDGIMAGAAGQTDVLPGRHHQPPVT
jgi:aryl-alcohol dehydrogenase-like predicted oxidoreductase